VATYYVDFVNGLDANNGLGPDATTGNTNKPWKTIAKLLGAAGMASGDTAYLSPAGPFREVVTVAMTSATGETQIIGDPANAQGFKTSAGVAVAPGPVIWSAYTTNDTTASSASALLTLAGRDFLTFKTIMLVGGTNTTANIVDATTTISTNVKFTDCSFLPSASGLTAVVSWAGSSNTAATWTLDRCLFICPGSSTFLKITAPTFTGADYDIAFTIKNSQVWMGGGGSCQFILTTTTGALANKPGGIRIYNMTSFGGADFLFTSTNWSTTTPCVVDNCFIYGQSSTVLNATTSGQITEDYNIFAACPTPRANVTTGTHSISNTYAPLFHFGQEVQQGFNQRPFGAPMSGSPILGLGNDGNQTTYDLYNRPRPAGGGTLPTPSANPAAGALERGNTWGKETTTVKTGSNALSITGPGYQDFDLDVDAAPPQRSACTCATTPPTPARNR
jgi:hypothetical protein